MKLKIFIILVILLIPSLCFSLDRCIQYKTAERIEATKYFGISFPYQYFLGQIKQESGCRADVVAFDKGGGVAQFMPDTSKYIQSLMGEKLNPFNPEQAIHMQSFYMYYIHTKENWSNKLWVDFQIYNGGAKILIKEYNRAKKADWTKMKAQCRRNKTKLKNGKILDACIVNYSYSPQIFKFGNEYNPLPSSFIYW
jgi:hypothetical protein